MSVVVLSYNRCELLRESLRVLTGLSPSALEVIVVDNASTDGSPDMVRAEFPGVRLIANDSNLGVARGRNVGFRASRGEFVVYLDDDSMAPHDVCARTVALFCEYPAAGCIAYQMCHDGHLWYECAEGAKVGNYYGGGHAFRASALQAIDYLDESMWFGGEEIDSSLRLYRAGYEVIAATSVCITNRGMVQSPEAATRRAADWYANFFGFYVRFFSSHDAARFVGRMTVSYLWLCVRRRTASPLVGGARRVLERLPETLRRRQVISDELAAFYADPALVPVHYNRSLSQKASEAAQRAWKRFCG